MVLKQIKDNKKLLESFVNSIDTMSEENSHLKIVIQDMKKVLKL
jgi:hypothetical protein